MSVTAHNTAKKCQGNPLYRPGRTSNFRWVGSPPSFHYIPETMLSKSVFISHAVKDKALVLEIVNLIEEGMGVPEDEIFCSSLDGYGIPSGKNFVTYIKEQLLKPEVVVLVLTPAYFESKFCLCELGAAWIKSHAIFPILVPPLQYSDVKDVLLGTQVAKVDDDIKYNELLGTLTAALAFKPKSQTKWDTKRRAFLKAIAPLLKKVAGPTVVAAADFKTKTDQLAEAQLELDASEAEIRRLKERLAATEALKDKIEVAALRAKHSVSKRFNALTDEVKEFRSVLKGGEVISSCSVTTTANPTESIGIKILMSLMRRHGSASWISRMESEWFGRSGR
jgi:hypothetical protein